ncbi:fimbrial protein [Burkholderia latens]|uniref:fimbrial protein n=1 Tax=Burkholderia latens TaxID=488446 RepID=UPI001AE793D2|nr:hypothetical protein [Burkholderia latens]QTO51631.1 hypothetical protein J8I86_19675 [Burkholderia latens]
MDTQLHGQFSCVVRTVFVGVALSMASETAWSVCTFSVLGETVSFTEWKLPRDKFVGTSQKKNLPTQSFLCDYGYIKTTARVVGGTLAPGYTNVYETGIRGLGIRFYGFVPTPSPRPFEPNLWATAVAAPFSRTINAGWPFTNKFSAAAELVVIGSLGTGTATNLPHISVQMEADPGKPIATYELRVDPPIKIEAQACRVATPDVNVTIPRGVTYLLDGPGSSAGATGFNIVLDNCPAGLAVHATFADASNPANRSDILSLAPESTASGLGYQVFFRSKAVRYGPDTSAAGADNQFMITDSATPSITVPLAAKYVKTSNDVQPGTAIGRIFFNMSYQ